MTPCIGARKTIIEDGSRRECDGSHWGTGKAGRINAIGGWILERDCLAAEWFAARAE
jgi:hypothetical protein